MKISVKVKAGSKREKVEQTAEGQYRVSVKAPPVDGKANLAVIALLAKYFDVPKSCVRVLHGHTSPQKMVEIE